MSNVPATKSPSVFGEDFDLFASKQLGLQGSHQIFLGSNQAHLLEEDKLEELLGDDLLSAYEILELVRQAMIDVDLPTGYMLVGLTPEGCVAPETYGIVRVPPDEASPYTVVLQTPSRLLNPGAPSTQHCLVNADNPQKAVEMAQLQCVDQFNTHYGADALRAGEFEAMACLAGHHASLLP